jgi:hypothetical protein
VGNLISGLIQANLGHCDEFYIPPKALLLLDKIQPGIHQQYLKHKTEDPDGNIAAIMNNAHPPQQAVTNTIP